MRGATSAPKVGAIREPCIINASFRSRLASSIPKLRPQTASLGHAASEDYQADVVETASLGVLEESAVARFVRRGAVSA